jgi:hypothetical protein
MQKLLLGHETETGSCLPSMLRGEAHAVPSEPSALPFPSTAMQKLLLGHETLLMKSCDVESIRVGGPQPAAASARRGDDTPISAIASPSQRARNQRKLR